MIVINDRLSIPENEVTLTASGSSGPGGQHVNRSNTRVTLWFDVAHSPSLTEEQKAKIYRTAGNRINKEGVLYLSAQDYRSQTANRNAVEDRFVEMLREALKPRPTRRRNRRPSKRAHERRIRTKKHRSDIKEKRKRVDW
jgi:ribosome-associated protein